jgi:hypothetical protein
VIVGTKPVGNFTTYAEPGLGAYLFALMALGVLALTAVHLIAGRRAARAEARAVLPGAVAASPS